MKKNKEHNSELSSVAATEVAMQKLSGPTTLDDIARVADRATSMLEAVRNGMLAPDPDKRAPHYSTKQLGELCGLERNKLNYQLSLGKLPTGELKSNGSSRFFTLAEAREWVKATRVKGNRPAGQRAKVIAVGSFKGGVTKTTTSMTLAQGLSLRGRSALIIDLDPQGTMTLLTGILAYSQVPEEATVLPLIYGDEPDLRYAVRKTYWDGIDLIPATTSLFSAEFSLPQQQMKSSEFEFWDVLRKGIEPLRDDYDVIIIDTPPSLSYLTINAFMAADGLIVPIPPSTLDYASSTQFWSLFSELAQTIKTSAERFGKTIDKQFDFVNVLLSKVNPDKKTMPLVRQWIRDTYLELVLPVEIPFTRAAETSSAEFGTVYDIEKYDGSQNTLKLAKEAYERFVTMIDQQLMTSWGITDTEE